MSETQKQEILVTGAGGALAQAVIKKLQDKYRVIAVDFRRRVQIEGDTISYRVDYNKREFEDIFRKHQIVGVLHLGRMGLHEADHKFRYNANVLGTQKLLDFCMKYGVQRVIVLSTYFVYGASPYNPALITEDYPLKASELTLDLVDAVELENLASIYLWKYPQLHISILRPCNIAGPGVLNSMSLLLSQKIAPVLAGFSPMMQFIHLEDMSEAIVLTFEKNHPGIYNVAVDDWVGYQEAAKQCGCTTVPLPSVPGWLPKQIAKWVNMRAFPSYLVNYYKFPVVLDGSHFQKTFNFKPKRSLDDIFSYYREKKELGIL